MKKATERDDNKNVRVDGDTIPPSLASVVTRLLEPSPTVAVFVRVIDPFSTSGDYTTDWGILSRDGQAGFVVGGSSVGGRGWRTEWGLAAK